MNGETLIHFEDGQSGIVRKMTVDEWFAMECARERCRAIECERN